MKHPLILPPALQVGDRIAYFSPSSPATAFAPTRHRRAVLYLEEQGFEVVPGTLTGQSERYRSGRIDARVEEFNALARDPTVRCIMSTIGGMNTNSLLPYIDYDALRRDPKIIVGYSDVTALLHAITVQTGLVTFYGPALVASLGEYSPLVDVTWRGFWDLVGDPRELFRVETPTVWTEEFLNWEEQTRAKVTQPNALRTLRGGVVRGRLVGGNLSTMSGLWDTPYCLKPGRGDILLVEDSLKSAAQVERLFAHLLLTGVMTHINGLILGKHELFDDQGTGKTPLDIFHEIFGTPPCPTLAEYDCSHTHPMMTLPLGAMVELDATAQHVTVLNPCVS